MRPQPAIRLDGETPLALVARVAVFAREHLLTASEFIRIEPQRNGERAAGELHAVFEFDQRLAIEY